MRFRFQREKKPADEDEEEEAVLAARVTTYLHSTAKHSQKNEKKKNSQINFLWCRPSLLVALRHFIQFDRQLEVIY